MPSDMFLPEDSNSFKSSVNTDRTDTADTSTIRDRVTFSPLQIVRFIQLVPMQKITIPATVDIEYSYVFEAIENFRDVGATINEFLGKRVMREGILFRSGRLDGATPEDKRSFKEIYGIKTVLDLRTDTERIVRFRQNQDAYDESESPRAAEPIVGVETHRIRLIGRNLEKALLRMLGWWSFFKVIFFMIIGFRISAIKIISKKVIEKVGLVGMGTLALEHSGNEIKKLFDILTSEENSPYPVIVHCTQGKDRTGLVIILILLCLHAASPGSGKTLSEQITLEALSHDYTLTQVGLRRVREEMMEEIVNDAGLPPSFINIDPNFVNAVMEFLTLKYDGIEGYLTSLGLDVDFVLPRLRGTLLICEKL